MGGGKFLTHFCLNVIFIHKVWNVYMKPDYKEKVLSNFEAMDRRLFILTEMLEGKRPSSDKEAKFHVSELVRLVENSRIIIDVS